MTEDVLIEMAKRFRALEECAEDPQLECCFPSEEPNATERLSAALEICRDDMVTMQEFIRKHL